MSTMKAPTWEDRHQRATWHAARSDLDDLRRHAKARGESFSAIVNRAIGELLDRET